MRAYFELEAQPDHKIEYTAKLDIAKRNRNPRFKSARGNGRGSGTQIVSARSRARIGVMINNSGDDVDGRIGSFVNSLIPSAIGWRSPKGPTMFGPFRACM